MLAFVFPGQGAQRVGMGKALAERYDVARETFARADDALGYAISQVCFEGPDADLQLTAHSQPAILTTSVAVMRVIREELGIHPDVVAGHSLGEYSALVCAGALEFEDAVRLVHKRGRFMQEAVPEGEGAMAAVIGLEDEHVEELCRDAAEDQVVAPANFNGAMQVVVAGHKDAVGRSVALAKGRGARAVPLKVSAPFHCPLMLPAAGRLAPELAAVPIRDPSVPVVCNVDAATNSEAARVADLLVRQVTGSVLWEASIRRMVEMGIERVLELGPGKVLAGLIRRIDGDLPVDSIGEPQQIEAFRQGPWLELSRRATDQDHVTPRREFA